MTNEDDAIPLDFGAQLARLLDACGWSQRRLARSVPCNCAYVSRMVNGRQLPARRVAAVIDELLGGGGTLTARLTEQKRLVRLQARQTHVNTGGISLTFPYAPMRLVIELSGIQKKTEIDAATIDGAIGELSDGQGEIALVQQGLQAGIEHAACQWGGSRREPGAPFAYRLTGSSGGKR